MIVRPTYHHTQIEIDVMLSRGKYSMNTLMTNTFLLIYKEYLFCLKIIHIGFFMHFNKTY